MNINPLLNYVKIATSKQLLISESHGDSNQYTTYMEKPDQHDTYASYAWRTIPTGGPRTWQSPMSHWQSWT
jgi:hypothetical protein